MAKGKKRVKSAKAASGSAQKTSHPTPAKRRNGLWKLLLVMAVLASVSVVGLTAYKRNWEAAHDLSVLGNGVPTVVQVHDPSCALCRSLKKNTQAALDRVDGQVQYRIADLNTDEGRILASRHQVGKVTLLLFDGGGQLISKFSGVKSVDTLEGLIAGIALPPANDT